MEPDQLIQGLQAGDEAAIEALIRGHEKNLYRLALSLLDDPAEAEEATQDTFIAALKAISSFRGEAALGSWLYRIASNLCLTRLRRRRVREQLNQAILALFRLTGKERDVHPEHATIQSESDAEVWYAIQNLGEKHRPVVILYYYHDMPVRDIAQILEIPEGTVYSRLETAHERLKGILKYPNEQLTSQVSVIPGKGSKLDPDALKDHVRNRWKLPDGQDYD